jgi:hypothetical protein
MYPSWLIDSLGMTKSDFRQNHAWGTWLFPAVKEGVVVEFVPLNCTVTKILEEVVNVTGIENGYVQPICDLEQVITDVDSGVMDDQGVNAKLVDVAKMLYRLIKKSALVWGRKRQLKNVVDNVGHFVERASHCQNKLVTTEEFSSILFRNNGYFKGYSTLTWIVGHIQFLLDERVELPRFERYLRNCLETMLLRRGQFLPIPVHASDYVYLVIIPLAGTGIIKYSTLDAVVRARLREHFRMFLRIETVTEEGLERALQRNWLSRHNIRELLASF